MGVKDTSSGNVINSTATVVNEEIRRQDEQSSTDRRSRDREERSSRLSGRATLNRRPTSRHGQSAILSKLLEALADPVKNMNAQAGGQITYTLIPVDVNQQPKAVLSTLLIAGTIRGVERSEVIVHPLILAGSAPLPDYTTGSRGDSRDAPYFVAGDIDTKDERTVWETEIGRYFNNQEIFITAPTTLQSDFDTESAEDVNSLVYNTTSAIWHYLFRQEAEDFKLRDLADVGNTVINLSFHNPNSLDYVSQLVRSDIQIQTVVTNRAERDRDRDRDDVDFRPVKTEEVSNLTAFPDLSWDPVETSSNSFNSTKDRNDRDTRTYAASLIITSMECPPTTGLSGALLSLASLSCAITDRNYLHAFMPVRRQRGGDLNIHDIGAIGYEIGAEKQRYDTLSEKFTGETLADMAEAFFLSGVRIAIDIPEAGPNSWYLSAFAAAAEGSKEANLALIDAANFLTDGRFAEIYEDLRGPTNVMTSWTRVHLGTYDANGETRDLRDIDYLANLNIQGQHSQDAMADWSETYDDTSIGTDRRMGQRKQIIDGLTNNTAKYTGYATRAVVEPLFFTALVKAIEECKWSPRLEMPTNLVRSGGRRGSNASRSSVNTDEISNRMFNRRRGRDRDDRDGRSHNRFGNRWR